MVREGIEDYRRYLDDRAANSQPVRVLTNVPQEQAKLEQQKEQMKKIYPEFQVGFPGCYEIVKAQDLIVGQVVLLFEDDIFPADLILLGSSDKDNKAYIETAMLDGEKNLKKREVNPTINALSRHDRFVFHGKVVCESPTHELDRFGGVILSRNVKMPISDKQCLMKGAKLKSTDWVTAVVAYTGRETKLMLNSSSGRLKQSRIEKMMNQLIILILLIQIFLCLIAAILAAVFQYKYSKEHYYLKFDDKSGLVFIINFFSYFLLLNTLIPISLVVTIEVVKFIHIFLMEWDVFCYRNTRFLKVSTCTIIEELGQVRYVFSDKTGTLTSNKMELKALRIYNVNYGDQSFYESSSAPLKRKLSKRITNDLEFGFSDDMMTGHLSTHNPPDSDTQYSVITSNGRSYELRSEKSRIEEFLKLLATCHDVSSTVIPESEYRLYSGQSPDEVCLVDAAQRLGSSFLDNRTNTLTIRQAFQPNSGKEINVQLLYSMPFTSKRARMSVIIRDEDRTLKLYCKGSDERLKKLLKVSEEVKRTDPVLVETDRYLDAAATKGFRTLYMGMKVLDEEEYNEWAAKMDELERFVPDNEAEAEKKKADIEELMEAMEKGQTYLGASVVEDKLQDNVENTIYNLGKAGVQVWMITGDKMGTARSIGLSCQMFTVGDMDIIEIGEKYVTKKQQIVDGKPTETDYIDEDQILADIDVQVTEANNKGKKLGLLITGTLVEYMVKSYKSKQKFISFAKTCTAVVCCRTTASQKAAVVRAMKDACPGEITLSIGDGGNDVPMINEAHVGVGIYGKEGMQAAQAADFAVGEFQVLWNLLMIHGRIAYIRIAELILYFFYKNVVFTMPQFFYAFFCFFSGQSFYDDWYIVCYNLVFTSIPLGLKALFETDVHHIKDNMLPLNRVYPYLYYQGQGNQIFNTKAMIFYLVYGLFHSCVTFFLPLAFVWNIIITEDGKTPDYCIFGLISMTTTVIVVTLKLFNFERFFSWINIIGFAIFGFGLYIIVQWSSQFSSIFKVYRSIKTLYSSPVYYLSVLVCCCLIYSVDHFIAVWNFHVNATPNDFCRLWTTRFNPVDTEENLKRLKKLDAITRGTVLSNIPLSADVKEAS
jgi:phospholipid-transporting ATPase